MLFWDHGDLVLVQGYLALVEGEHRRSGADSGNEVM